MPFPVQDQAAGTEIIEEQKEQEKAYFSVSKGLQLQEIQCFYRGTD